MFLIVLAWLCSLLVMLSGDVKVHSGPKNKDKDCHSICQWNLNSISAYDYSKLFLLNSYNSHHKVDMICLSETYLDSNTENSLPLRAINIGYLNECLTLEIKIGYKICNFVIVYTSTSQSEDEFETFSVNFEITLEFWRKNIRF